MIFEKLEEIFKVEKISSNNPFLPTERHEFGMNISGNGIGAIKEDLLNRRDRNIKEH